MTWFEFVVRQTILKCAAVFVAHFICVGTALAQEVTFRSSENAVVVTGRFIAFDDNAITVLTENGPVTFRADDMVCESEGCPDLENYWPRLRLIGAPEMADLLMPALIDVYARDKGWRVREDVHGFQMDSADGQRVFDIELIAANSSTAFDTFVGHNADALLSMRELRDSELELAYKAGLGRLNLARQGRIVALDALVPVVSPSSGVRAMPLSELTEIFADPGEFDVIMPLELSGQLQGFEDRFMRPLGLSIAKSDENFDSEHELTSAIEQSPNAISLVSFGATRNTQPLALSGPCGLKSEARFLTMKTEDYPLTFPMFLYVPQRAQHPQIEDFFDWLRSPSAQLVIRRAGFADLAAVPIPLANQGDRLAAAITSAGPEVPLNELQRLVRILSPRVRMSSTFRFEPGSTRLDGQSRSNVMQLAQAIRDGRFGGRELMFVGFSDGRGPSEANRDLSAARAESVRRDVENALGGRIPSNVKIETEAFGEALPMACDDTIWGQQTNRRVELWVRDPG